MFSYLAYLMLVAGLYLGARALGLVHKKQSEDSRPSEAQNVEKYLVLGIAALLISVGIYLLWPASESNPTTTGVTNQTPPSEPNYANLANWTDESRLALMNQCMENGRRTAEKYPEIVKQYCECATSKITLAFTPQSYQDMLSKPVEERRQVISPVVESCVMIMNKLIQLTDEAKPQPKGQ